ncbi:MAG: regulatory protein RecX [Muribaculaceae bacterium]|nr:regulatory protein RecX [Muribaculaceae bacterium]
MNKTPISPAIALTRAQNLCARCEQAPAAIRTKMLSWGLSKRDADALVDQLTADGFLNEQRYARAFVHDKFLYNHWGRNKIAFELKRNGIDSETIASAMLAIDDDEYRDTIARIITDRARSLSGKTPLQVRASLARFAASRGIEPDLAYDIINNLTPYEQD